MAQNVLITGTGRPYALGFNLGNERDCPYRSLFTPGCRWERKGLSLSFPLFQSGTR